MKTRTITTTLVSTITILLLVTGCAQSIGGIKQEAYVGEIVTLRGEVVGSVKIGSLSGYLLEDDEGERIAVTSEELLAEGDMVTVTGTLMRDSIFGYYLQPKK